VNRPSERADARRNRTRILAATRTLVAREGAEGLTVATVARAAGVGPATVVRRFGDKSGLLSALLDEEERDLQEDILRGRPPVGPGAPPGERIVAFLAALAALTDEHLELLFASETAKPGARFRTGAYSAWRQHLTLLLAEAGPELDAPVVADLLLAPLAAESFDHLRRRQGLPLRDVQAAQRRLAEGLLAGVTSIRST